MNKLQSKSSLTYGRRTGVNVVKGKKIRKGEDGIDLFDDYWTESGASSESEKLNENVRQQNNDTPVAQKNERRLKVLRRKREHIHDQVEDLEKEYKDNSVSDRSRNKKTKKQKSVAAALAYGRRTGANIVEGKNIRQYKDGAEVFDDYWTDSVSSLASDKYRSAKVSKSKNEDSILAYGRRTGVNIIKGKNIRKGEDGADVFDDYWTKSRISLEQSRKNSEKQKMSVERLSKSVEVRRSGRSSVANEAAVDDCSSPTNSEAHESANSSKNIAENVSSNWSSLSHKLCKKPGRTSKNSNLTIDSSKKSRTSLAEVPFGDQKLAEDLMSRNTRSKRMNESTELSDSEISQSRKKSKTSQASTVETEMHDTRLSDPESESYIDSHSSDAMNSAASEETLSLSQINEGTPEKQSETSRKRLSSGSATESPKSTSSIKGTPEKHLGTNRKRSSSGIAVELSESTPSTKDTHEKLPEIRRNRLSSGSATESPKSTPSTKGTPKNDPETSRKRLSSDIAVKLPESTPSAKGTPEKQTKTTIEGASEKQPETSRTRFESGIATESPKSTPSKGTHEKRTKTDGKRLSSADATRSLKSTPSAKGEHKKLSKTGNKRLSSSSAIDFPKSKRKQSHVSDIIKIDRSVSVAESSKKSKKLGNLSSSQSNKVLKNVRFSVSEVPNVSQPESECRVTKKSILISPEKAKKQNKGKKKLVICDGKSSEAVTTNLRKSTRRRMAPLPHYLNVYPRYRRTESGDYTLIEISEGTKKDDRNENAILKRYTKMSEKKTAIEQKEREKKRRVRVKTIAPVFFPEMEQEVDIDFIRPFSQLTWHCHRSSSDDSEEFFIAKAYDSNECSLGLLKINRFKKKSLQYVPNDDLHFFVKDGRIKVQIHRSFFKLREGDHFIVPHGNAYSISNSGFEPAILTFGVGRSAFLKNLVV